MSGAGDGQRVNNVNLTFDQAAGTAVPVTGPLVSGSYRPASYLSGITFPPPAPAGSYSTTLDIFKDANPNGAWRLYVRDHTAGDNGSITGWSLTINAISPVNPNANLAVALTGPVGQIVPGTPVTYLATVQNLGPDQASDVTLSNLVPAGMTVVGASVSQGTTTISADGVVADLGGLLPGSNALLSVVLQPTTLGAKTVTAAAFTSSLDLNLLNNIASVVTLITNATADLAVGITAAPEPVVLGQNLTYTISVANQGPQAAAGIWLTNTVQAGDLIVSAVPSQGINYSLAGGRVICYLGDLGVDGTATVVVRATTLSLGSHQDRVEVTASTADPVPANNLAVVSSTVMAPVPVVVAAGVSLVAEFGVVNGAIEPGERVTLNLALRNSGAAGTTNLVATLLAGQGVVLSDGPQSGAYVVLTAGGPPVARPFTFQAVPTSGDTVTAVLSLRDGNADLGTASFTVPVSTVTSVASATGLLINDTNLASPYPCVIVVSNLTQPANKVTVTVAGFTHASPADVRMLLVGPGGQAVELMSGAGAGQAVTDVTLGFDDDAATGLPQFSQLTSGSYQPTSFEPGLTYPVPAPPAPYEAALAAFAGLVPNGTWSLFVLDDVAGDAGRIGGWSLSFITSRPVPGGVDLAVSSSVQPAVVPIAGAMTLTVTAVNYGPAEASEVILSNRLSESFYVDSMVPSKGSLIRAGNLVICSVGTLTNGETFTLTANGSPTASGALTNLAGAASAEQDSNPANNLSLLAVPVAPPALAVRLVGETVILSWPNLASGYLLEWTDTLDPSAVWQIDGNVPVVINGENVVFYSIYDGYRLFFRLVKP
jgi:uncharacterized repeat protein (TIGR01451 family)